MHILQKYKDREIFENVKLKIICNKAQRFWKNSHERKVYALNFSTIFSINQSSNLTVLASATLLYTPALSGRIVC